MNKTRSLRLGVSSVCLILAIAIVTIPRLLDSAIISSAWTSKVGKQLKKNGIDLASCSEIVESARDGKLQSAQTLKIISNLVPWKGYLLITRTNDVSTNITVFIIKDYKPTIRGLCLFSGLPLIAFRPDSQLYFLNSNCFVFDTSSL